MENELWRSSQGFARTLPTESQELESLCLAYVSCQYFGTGFYTVYQSLAQDRSVDFCVHLGDSIYEATGGLDVLVRVRPDFNGEAKTKEDYRARYRLALSDPHYREARRLHTWICIPDDHEVQNDYSGVDPSIVARRAAGLKAYAEYMPVYQGNIHLEPPSFRRFVMGDLVTIYALDLRTYRDGQVCPKNNYTKACDAISNPERTLMGREQREWLETHLTHSESRWNVLLSQVLMMPLAVLDRPKEMASSPLEAMLSHSPLVASLDSWDGYPSERDKLCQTLKSNRPSSQRNTLVWSGDIHNLYSGYLGGVEDPVAFEVSTGSISSFGVGDVFPWGSARLVEHHMRIRNPHFSHLNLRSHMYVKCTLTGSDALFESVCVDTIRKPQSSSRIGERIRVAWGTLQTQIKA